MVAEERVETVPVTTCQMVAEERVEPYEVRTCQMVAEERVETIPVTTCQMVAEERVEPYEVRTCQMVAEERVENDPRDHLPDGRRAADRDGPGDDLPDGRRDGHAPGAGLRRRAGPRHGESLRRPVVARTVAVQQCTMVPVAVPTCMTCPVSFGPMNEPLSTTREGFVVSNHAQMQGGVDAARLGLADSKRTKTNTRWWLSVYEVVLPRASSVMEGAFLALPTYADATGPCREGPYRRDDAGCDPRGSVGAASASRPSTRKTHQMYPPAGRSACRGE